MNKFIFILTKKRPKELEKKLLVAHIEHLKNLKLSGRLTICGPFLDNENAIQIISAETKEEAIHLFEQDPFVQQKYYEEYVVHEFLEANEENNWLIDDSQTIGNLKQ